MQKLLLFFLALTAGPSLLWGQSEMTIIVNSSADVGGDADADDGTCADMNGDCTLRAAIDVANAASGMDVTIVLPGRLPGGNSGTYSITNVAPDMMENTFEDENEFGDFDITGDFASLSIEGTGRPGASVTSSPNDRIFDILTTAPVNLERIWINGGTARAGENGTEDGSGVGVDGTNGANGGGMRIGGNAMVTMDQVTFSGNFTQSGGNGASPTTSIERTNGGAAGSGGRGGALFISRGATVDIVRGSFTGNGTGDGGSPGSGQAANSGEAAGGNGGNGGNGGAIYNAGDLTLTSCTIWNNTGGSPSQGATGTNGGSDGEVGEGGSGAGIANSRRFNTLNINEGNATLINTIVAGNTPGDDTSNGKQPGPDLFDASNGSTFTLTDENLIGSIDGVTEIRVTNLIGLPGQEIDPMITGQNSNEEWAVPVPVISMNSPAVDAGTTMSGEFNIDARGFTRPAGEGIDIGSYELDGEVPPVSLRIDEIDVVASEDTKEFIEIRNTGDYTVQMDEYVIAAFGESLTSTSCFVTNLYGQLEPGERFTIGDTEVAYTVEQPLGFDVISNTCEGDMENQLPDGTGAVALYEGDGGNFTGIMAGSESEERIDVIVYTNPTASESSVRGGITSSQMNDLCGAFGLGDDCAAMDSGDDSSIQRGEDGSAGSGAPTPGAENMLDALPVELVSFTGYTPKTNTVELNWATTRETANAGFTVQHQQRGRWAEVAWVTGAGDSDRELAYSTTLSDIPAGEQLFRLRQQDFDGATSYSNIVSVNLSNQVDLAVFPNPTVGLFTVNQADATAGSYELQLIDAAGRMVRSQRTELRSAGTLRTTMDISDLVAAPYFLRVVGPAGVTTLPVSKR